MLRRGLGSGAGGWLVAELYHLKRRLDDIDRKLRVHRGPATPEQAQLLRARRECLLELADAERQFWGA